MTEDKKITGFCFVDMSLAGDTREIDGMSEGEFTDMYGRDAIIESLDDYVKNTTENLEATRTEDGELVGLPIDAYGHDNGDGAGWITGVRREGSIVRFAVKWTEIGMDLIKKNIRRFFSPTIDTNTRVILGGSLTNWPATRTKKGKILLRPVALSEQLMSAEIEEDQGILQRIYDLLGRFVDGFKGEPEKPQTTQMEEHMDLKDLTPEQVAELQSSAIAQLSSNPPAELSALIEAEATRRMTAMLEAEQRKAHVADFAARVVGGSDDKPIGLPVAKDKLVEFMTSLSAEQQKAAEEILSAIHDKAAVDFSEHGHGKQLTGTAELPEWAKKPLTEWLSAKQPIEQFFAVNSAELGEMKDYNLAEYQPKEQ